MASSTGRQLSRVAFAPGCGRCHAGAGIFFYTIRQQGNLFKSNLVLKCAILNFLTCAIHEPGGKDAENKIPQAGNGDKYKMNLLTRTEELILWSIVRLKENRLLRAHT